MKIRVGDKDIELNKWYDEKDDRNFKQEIHWISTTLGISPARIRIDGEHPCGEDCIFIDGKWDGYLDRDFYSYMIDGYDPYGDLEAWVEIWRKRNETSRIFQN